MPVQKQKQRESRLNLRLSDDMMTRLDAISEEMGLAPTTIGAVAIAEYVTQRERNREVANRAVEVGTQSNSRVVEQFLREMVPQLLAAQGISPGELKATEERRGDTTRRDEKPDGERSPD